MTLDKAKRILRIAGIVAVIGGFFAMILGIMLTTNRQNTLTTLYTNNLQSNGFSDSSKTSGLLTTFSGAFGLAEGVCSFLASKKNRYGSIAGTFSLLSLILNVGNCGNTIREEGFTLLNSVNLLITLCICGVIFASANKVRKAHKTGA